MAAGAFSGGRMGSYPLPCYLPEIHSGGWPGAFVKSRGRGGTGRTKANVKTNERSKSHTLGRLHTLGASSPR
jgi:hypothetical protein